ncbi:tubulin polyglutamylase complex subunit 2 [Bacillus rossius redtenbacheri]|uniref:tubulin polyglutamylase complex subunit 2 n=1 Tax=Bacillus rossius redtenbacheri TaxID=93214 RepID=UPI002FDDA92B
MSLVSDSESENLFYHNLTVGVMEILEGTEGVQDIAVEKRLPCERVLLSSWEQRHCCTLPEDLRQFYLSTDGFRLVWNYRYTGQVLPVGNMRVNAISELRRVGGLKSGGDADCPNPLDAEACWRGEQQEEGLQRPSLGAHCKVFELDPCGGLGKVCLAYVGGAERELQRHGPSVWLLDRCCRWHPLARGFTQYFRMMLVHLGLPQWQFRHTPAGLTPWAEQMFAMIAPHLLQNDNFPTHGEEWDLETHSVDPAIFKTQRKTSRKRSDAKPPTLPD